MKVAHSGIELWEHFEDRFDGLLEKVRGSLKTRYGPHNGDGFLGIKRGHRAGQMPSQLVQEPNFTDSRIGKCPRDLNAKVSITLDIRK